MANNNFLFALPEHEVLGAVTPTLTNANASYPATLASDFSNGDVVAKPSLSTAFTDRWVWDFTVPTRIDVVFLWHNVDAGSVIKVEANSANSWPGTVSKSLTAAAKHKLGFTRKQGVDMTIVSGYSTGGFRYFSVQIPTNSAKPGLKILAFSRFTRLVCNIARDFDAPLMQNAITLATNYGHEWVYKLPAAREAFSPEILVANSTDMAAVQSWFEACGRGVACCILNTDVVHNANAQAMMGRLTSTSGGLTQAESGVNTQIHERRLLSGKKPAALIKFGIRELTAGLPEWT